MLQLMKHKYKTIWTAEREGLPLHSKSKIKVELFLTLSIIIGEQVRSQLADV